MAPKIITDFKVTISSDGIGHLSATTEGGDTIEDLIPNCDGLSADTLHNKAIEHIEKMLGYSYVPKKTTLKLAKVTLKLAVPNAYALFIKGTDKFVYKVDERGIYVSNAKSQRPLAFTDDDLSRIDNINDFDVKKLNVYKSVTNKL